MPQKISQGVVHKVPDDLRQILVSNSDAYQTWQDLTPLARNEWICWIVSTKKPETREKHVERALEDLAKGKRRPCCWMGCVHRKDKPMSKSQKYILGKKKNND